MRISIFVSTMLVWFAGAAFAQYSGPSEVNDEQGQTRYTQTTIQAIIDDPKDGNYVSVDGVLVRKLDEETYLFSDGIAEIEVEIDEDDFPKSDVSETTRVRIEGKVDTHLIRDVDIEADRIKILE